MKTLLVIICFGAFLPSLFAQDNQKVLAELDAYVARTCHYLGDAPYAIVVSKNGKIIHERYSEAGALGKIDTDSRWQLYSISKSFACAAILTLVQEGVIKLDDPVSKYLPAFKTKGNGTFDRRNVTIRNLASHTSGTAVNGVKLPTQLPEDLNEIEIVTEPGKDFLYSGLGMYLLEKTLEAATGKDYGDLLKEKVTDPLGLKSANFVYSKEDAAKMPILPLRPNNFKYSQKGSRVGSELFINARDLNKFGNFWLSPEKLFSTKLRAEAWTWHGTRDLDGGNYGLLWWLFPEFDSYTMSGHQYKVNAVIPSKKVVVTVIRLPQNGEIFEFWADKHKIISLGNRL